MAKTWSASVQINGDDVTIYSDVEYEVSDELYEKIQEAVNSGKLLSECGFFDELRELASNAFDLVDYLGLMEEEPEKPNREDFEDEEYYQEEMEYYQEELEEFQESIDCVWDNYSQEEVNVYDPNELKYFKEKFIGRQVPECTGEAGEIKYKYEEIGFRIVRYEVRIEYDQAGVITDLSVRSDGMESESVRSSSWNNCHPDYGFLERHLNEDLERK